MILQLKYTKEGELLFSKIFFRFSLICIAAVAAVLLIVSIIVPISDTYFYFNQMKKDLYAVAESNFTDDLKYIIQSHDNAEEREKSMSELIGEYSGKLALNENRKFYIFDIDYNYIAPKEQFGDIREKSDNLSNVSDNADKNTCSLFDDFIDCAAVTKSGSDSYILYVRDNKTSLRMMMYHRFKFLALSGFIA